jgi:hypothetical protein
MGSEDRVVRVKIDDDYFIKIDKLNHTLCKKRVSEETGKEYEQIIGYYGSIVSTLKAYIRDNRLNIGKCESMEVFIDRIEEHDRQCLGAIKHLVEAMDGVE